MEFKVEPNRLASLSKRMLNHQSRAKTLRSGLEREADKINSILSRTEFPPSSAGQLTATNDSIKGTSKTIVNTLEYQGAWISYFVHKASGADDVPLSLAQAVGILGKYDERFRDPKKESNSDLVGLVAGGIGSFFSIEEGKEALTGKDASGRQVSNGERALAGVIFVAGFIPVTKLFKVAKGGAALYKITKEGKWVKRISKGKTIARQTIISNKGKKIDITPSKNHTTTTTIPHPSHLLIV